MENILSVTNLSKNYKEFNLKNVSFSLPKGAIMGLIGENGAGKTTIIKAILNQIKRDSGEVIIFDLDNLHHDKEIKENLGVVFDENFLHGNLNSISVSKIMSNIYKNFDTGLFDSLLNKFKLPEKLPVKDFSRGMRMKLSIAAALAHKPKLLILDEATSGLDPIVRNEILDIFLEFIQNEEHSILLSSHITSDLEKICDYITFVHQGSVVFSEEKDTLLYDYGIVKCPCSDIGKINPADVLGYRKNSFGCEVLVKNKERVKISYPEIDKASIEDIMMLMIKGEKI